MTDGITVFDDVLTLGGILDEDLVTGWRILVHHDLSTVHLNNVPLLFLLQTNHHAVRRINLQVSS